MTVNPEITNAAMTINLGVKQFVQLLVAKVEHVCRKPRLATRPQRVNRGALYKKLRFVNVRNVGTNLEGWYVSWCNFPAKPEIRTHVSYVSKRNFLYNAPQAHIQRWGNFKK